ncbi:MAG TPA: VCBS repeat-containing protein, partial [Pyrinomonadaceae bacterium]
MTQSNDEKQGKGALRNDQDRLMFGEGFSFSGYERDPLYMNTGAKKFVDISGVSGIDSITDGRASVFADFDNDGDLDVFMTSIQGESHHLFRNNVGQENNYLRVVLEGAGAETGGREAFGAVVRVKTSAG